ncbi:MAG: glutathionylspermidine synthase family protein [Acidobacteriota bacterium]
MNPASSEPVLPDYGEFARMLYRTAILSDPWLNGRERFRLRGVVLEEEKAAELKDAAERVAYLHHELATIVWSDPALLDDFFELTPFQKAMWLASGARWHGIARTDLFVCSDGRIRACEMNSDTPSGEAEAVVLNQILYEFHPETVDPNTGLEESFVEMLLASYRSDREGLDQAVSHDPSTVAIIYPTDLPEDLSMIALYRDWLERRGCRVVLGSPFNLTFDSRGRVLVLGEVIDLVVRHYKTDWWSEREPIWKDQPPFPDAEPLDRQLLPLLDAQRAGRVTIVNPFGAVLLQNKKSMAFMWEHREKFSSKAQVWIEELIPETRRFSAMDALTLKRREWVVKSVYGCEGDSVYCGPFVTSRQWRSILARVEPRHWVLQRFFEVEPGEDGLLANFGVYVVGGSARAFYTRLSTAGTDYTAVTTPTYISASER